MRRLFGALAAAGLMLSLGASAFAKDGVIVFDRPAMSAPETIALSAAGFPRNGPIPRQNSSYDDNISPELRWTGVPPETKSIALIIEDPDAPPVEPVVHWLIWNITPDLSGLPAGVSTAKKSDLGDITQGRNSHDETGYYGPHPSQGDPAHRYFFQIYALDRMLDATEGSGIEGLVAAMKGHILARGELVGTFVRPDNPKHP